MILSIRLDYDWKHQSGEISSISLSPVAVPFVARSMMIRNWSGTRENIGGLTRVVKLIIWKVAIRGAAIDYWIIRVASDIIHLVKTIPVLEILSWNILAVN